MQNPCRLGQVAADLFSLSFLTPGERDMAAARPISIEGTSDRHQAPEQVRSDFFGVSCPSAAPLHLLLLAQAADQFCETASIGSAAMYSRRQRQGVKSHGVPAISFVVSFSQLAPFMDLLQMLCHGNRFMDKEKKVSILERETINKLVESVPQAFFQAYVLFATGSHGQPLRVFSLTVSILSLSTSLLVSLPELTKAEKMIWSGDASEDDESDAGPEPAAQDPPEVGRRVPSVAASRQSRKGEVDSQAHLTVPPAMMLGSSAVPPEGQTLAEDPLHEKNPPRKVLSSLHDSMIGKFVFWIYLVSDTLLRCGAYALGFSEVVRPIGIPLAIIFALCILSPSGLGHDLLDLDQRVLCYCCDCSSGGRDTQQGSSPQGRLGVFALSDSLSLVYIKMAGGWPIFGLLARLSEVVLYSGQARPIDSQCAGPGAALPLLQLREELSQRVAERKVATEALARRILASLARLECEKAIDERQKWVPDWFLIGFVSRLRPCPLCFCQVVCPYSIIQRPMTRAWALALALLAFQAHGDLQAMQLSADGEIWSYPMEAARRLMRHQKGARAYLQEVDGQPSDTAEKVVTISTNETHNVDDTGLQDAFTKELKAEAATASSGTGLALFGTLLCAMILFYLVNQPHKDSPSQLRSSLLVQLLGFWVVFGSAAHTLQCSARTCKSVILFMALKKLWKCILGNLQAYQDPSERFEWGSQLATVGYILSFLKFAALMFFFPLLKSKLQDKTRLAAARTGICGTYLIGYAGSDSFAYILSLEPFSSGAGYYFLGLLLMLAVLFGLLCLAFRLADRMQPSDGYDPDREEEQIEAAGFQVAFLLSVWIRFLVTGFLPGSKKGARALILSERDLAQYLWSSLGTCLLLSVVIFGVAMFKIRPLAGQTDRTPAMRRFFRLLTETSAMTMGRWAVEIRSE
eukprot:s216_g16.t1